MIPGERVRNATVMARIRKETPRIVTAKSHLTEKIKTETKTRGAAMWRHCLIDATVRTVPVAVSMHHLPVRQARTRLVQNQFLYDRTPKTESVVLLSL